MILTRQIDADKLRGYLDHRISLLDLANWAESGMMGAEFDDTDFVAIRDAVARLGVADVRAFGLTWEDCESVLNTLGYRAHVDIAAVK